MRRNGRDWITVTTVLSLMVAVSLVSWYVQPSALDFARDSLAQRRGVPADELELVGHESFSPLTPAVMSTMTVTFRIKGVERSKKEVVELFRLVYFLPWWVSAYRDGVEERPQEQGDAALFSVGNGSGQCGGRIRAFRGLLSHQQVKGTFKIVIDEQVAAADRGRGQA